MAVTRELAYAWRDRGTCFLEHAAIAQAVQQLIQQVQGLPPGSTVVEPVTIEFGGTVTDVEAGQPDQQYIFKTVYSLPPQYVE